MRYKFRLLKYPTSPLTYVMMSLKHLVARSVYFGMLLLSMVVLKSLTTESGMMVDSAAMSSQYLPHQQPLITKQLVFLKVKLTNSKYKQETRMATVLSFPTQCTF